MMIYHIVLADHWNTIDADADYEAESLSVEGFIHCSCAGQLETVLQRYYADAASVLILEIDTDKLSARLVEEASTNNEIYPHIYGPINRDAIVGVKTRQL